MVFNPSQKYEFVSWDDDIPNWTEKIKFMFQTTNQVDGLLPIMSPFNRRRNPVHSQASAGDRCRGGKSVGHPPRLGDGGSRLGSRNWWENLHRKPWEFYPWNIGVSLVGGFDRLEKYESQWIGLSHILWKITNVWNHQPAIVSGIIIHYKPFKIIPYIMEKHFWNHQPDWGFL